MEVLKELEQLGFVFSVDGGKISYQYKGNEQPDEKAASLLGEVKKHKDEAVQAIQNRIILQAWNGQLEESVLIIPVDKWREFWGGAVWLCPDEPKKQQIRQKDHMHLAITTDEFFNVCAAIADQGEEVKSVLECLRLFGGSLVEDDSLNKGAA